MTNQAVRSTETGSRLDPGPLPLAFVLVLAAAVWVALMGNAVSTAEAPDEFQAFSISCADRVGYVWVGDHELGMAHIRLDHQDPWFEPVPPIVAGDNAFPVGDAATLEVWVTLDGDEVDLETPCTTSSSSTSSSSTSSTVPPSVTTRPPLPPMSVPPVTTSVVTTTKPLVTSTSTTVPSVVECCICECPTAVPASQDWVMAMLWVFAGGLVTAAAIVLGSYMARRP